jgi:hypothetical protein
VQNDSKRSRSLIHDCNCVRPIRRSSTITELSEPSSNENVSEPALKLSARALQLQNDRPALIEADKMEAILAEIDADRADGGG